MMRVEDIDKAKHYASELAKLRAAQVRVNDETSTNMRLFFFAEQYDAESPSVTVGAQDREFGAMMEMARSCLKRDIAEIAETLRSLGVNPEDAGPNPAGISDHVQSALPFASPMMRFGNR